MDKTSLGDRMKCYESVTRNYLTKRVPVIVRLDGKAFHTLTRKYFKTGFDFSFLNIMKNVAIELCSSVQGCNLAYCQSDEISLLLTDYKTIKTDGYFDYNISKIVSTTASLASSVFSIELFEKINIPMGYLVDNFFNYQIVQFDSRAFNISQDEVCNYFIWRQNDATRNAILNAGQEHFSHKQLYGKSCDEVQEMLFKEKGINFNDYSAVRKRGFCVIDKQIDDEIPIFTQNRDYIEKHVYIRED